MSQICEYCDDDHDVNDTVFAIVSHGFGHDNKEHKPFCSVECRTWWRRRCSDDPGEWEQPHTPGYQGRLDRFVSNNGDEIGVKPVEFASEAATGQEASA
jgi:hypothetical protein